jgi:hypothetical protein
MIDNFSQISRLLTFDSDDDFYFLQIIKRKKEHAELGSNSYIVKTYYIKSVDDLLKNKSEIECLCKFHYARACINLNRRSFHQLAFQSLKKITDQILNKDFSNVRRAYNSVCGAFNNESKKTWVIDIDHKNRREINDVVVFIDRLQPVGGKFVDLIETKNGFHVITTPFNVSDFIRAYPEIEVHKDNPTILYIP